MCSSDMQEHTIMTVMALSLARVAGFSLEGRELALGL